MKLLACLVSLALFSTTTLAFAQTEARQSPAFFVNNQMISENEFSTQSKNASKYFETLWKAKTKNDLPEFLKFDLQQSILHRLILTNAMEQDAIAVGFDVSDEELTDAVYKYRRALGLSSLTFRNQLEEAGFTEDGFNKLFRQQLRNQKRILQIQNDTSLNDEERKLYELLFDTSFEFPNSNIAKSLVELLERSLTDVKVEGVLEGWLTHLRQEAQVRFPEGSALAIYNPVVARVADTSIFLQDINEILYFGTTVLDVLENPDQAQKTIQTKLQPEILNTLIDQALAAQYAESSDRAFFGGKAAILEQVKRYQGLKATVSLQEAKSYYQQNAQYFQQPAQANVTILTFQKLKDADQFRKNFKRFGGDPIAVAKKLKAKIDKHGVAREWDFTADARKAIFKERLTTIRKLQFSRNIKDAKETVIVLVKDLKAAKARAFETVLKDITARLKIQKQKQVGEAWLKAARKAIPIENHLLEVQAEINRRLSTASEPSEPVTAPSPSVPTTPEPAPTTPPSPNEPPVVPPNGLLWSFGLVDNNLSRLHF
jgi:hypothetical protein